MQIAEYSVPMLPPGSMGILKKAWGSLRLSGESGSGIVSLAEDGRADTHNSGAFLDSHGIIMTHAHGKLRQRKRAAGAQLRRQFPQCAEGGSGAFGVCGGGGDAHEAAYLQMRQRHQLRPIIFL